MSLFLFQRQLEESVGSKLQLKINDNRSTMLSVKWSPDCTHVSLHRMFLKAPENVMEALGCYLRQEVPKISPSVKAFIEEGLKGLDYSHLLDQKKIIVIGVHYNLMQIYDRLNEEYFDNKLQLKITWFGKAQKARSRIVFGLYFDPLKLIKISRLLDDPFFPSYVVEYVVYHEMVHAACPSYVDVKGIHRIHSPEFKEREKEYKYFDKAQDWIKRNQRELFQI